MKMSFTKKPMKPISTKPRAVLEQILLNSVEAAAGTHAAGGNHPPTQQQQQRRRSQSGGAVRAAARPLHALEGRHAGPRGTPSLTPTLPGPQHSQATPRVQQTAISHHHHVPWHTRTLAVRLCAALHQPQAVLAKLLERLHHALCCASDLHGAVLWPSRRQLLEQKLQLRASLSCGRCWGVPCACVWAQGGLIVLWAAAGSALMVQQREAVTPRGGIRNGHSCAGQLGCHQLNCRGYRRRQGIRGHTLMMLSHRRAFQRCSRHDQNTACASVRVCADAPATHTICLHRVVRFRVGTAPETAASHPTAGRRPTDRQACTRPSSSVPPLSRRPRA
jgi:hypothetical protein